MNWRIQIAAYTIQCTEDYHDKGLGNMSNLRAQGGVYLCFQVRSLFLRGLLSWPGFSLHSRHLLFKLKVLRQGKKDTRVLKKQNNPEANKSEAKSDTEVAIPAEHWATKRWVYILYFSSFHNPDRIFFYIPWVLFPFFLVFHLRYWPSMEHEMRQ